MAVEIQRDVARYQKGSLPDQLEAESITNLLVSAWRLETGEVVYAYRAILQPHEWISENGLVGKEIHEGRMHISTTRDTDGKIIATSSLIVKDDGHIELGRVANSSLPEHKGAGSLAVEDSVRIIKELDLPGAIVDEASNRTSMKVALEKAAKATGFAVLPIYVSHAAYGVRDIASWGCFGDFIVNPKFLQEGRLQLPVHESLPEHVKQLLHGISRINDDYLEAIPIKDGESGDILNPKWIVMNEIAAIDLFDVQGISACEEKGYYASGILPVVYKEKIHWMIQYCKEKIPEVVHERATDLRRDISRMYTIDKKQQELAQLVQDLYPQKNQQVAFSTLPQIVISG